MFVVHMMLLFKSSIQKLIGTININKQLMSSCNLNIENTTKTVQNILNISNVRAQYIILKQPSICKLDSSHIQQVTKTLEDLGVNKLQLADVPVLLTYHPITVRYRYQVLSECGISEVTAEKVAKYLTLIKKYTIKQLKDSNHISQGTPVAKKLADIFTQWPTSRSSSLLKIDENKCSLFEARVQILQRYLELVIDLPEEEFIHKFKMYVQLRHRPLEQINQILIILQKHVMMSSEKIRSNFFLLYGNPENLKRMLYEVREIAGQDIKEVIKLRPKLITTNVDNIIAIQNLFKRNQINEIAQMRCIEVFTLCFKTVAERLEMVQSIPEFRALYNHPRFLKIVYYHNSAMKRLETLRTTNKKCFSLHILSGPNVHYKAYEEAPGERNKGTDLVYSMCKYLDVRATTLRNKLKLHDYWKNTPIVQATTVLEHLSCNFSQKDICENCWIILYPWKKIHPILNYIINKGEDHDNIYKSVIPDNLIISTLTKSQILSLTLYIMEKEHYFTGNGMWNEESPKFKKVISDDNDVQLKSGFMG